MSQPAIIPERSKKTQFLNAASTRSHILHGGILVQVVEVNGRLDLWFKPPQNITARALKQAASEIAGWRHALTAFQGNSPSEEWYAAIYTRLLDRKSSGDSWDDLATLINHEVAVSLTDYYKVRGITPESFAPLWCARDWLLAMRFSLREVDEILRGALDDLQNHHSPFGGMQKKKSGKLTYFIGQAPVTANRVRRILKPYLPQK